MTNMTAKTPEEVISFMEKLVGEERRYPKIKKTGKVIVGIAKVENKSYILTASGPDLVFKPGIIIY